MLLESKGTKKATAEAWHKMKRHIGVKRGTPFDTKLLRKRLRTQAIPASIHNSQSRGNKSVCFHDGCVLTFSCKELQVLDLMHLLSNFFQIITSFNDKSGRMSGDLHQK